MGNGTDLYEDLVDKLWEIVDGGEKAVDAAEEIIYLLLNAYAMLDIYDEIFPATEAVARSREKTGEVFWQRIVDRTAERWQKYLGAK